MLGQQQAEVKIPMSGSNIPATEKSAGENTITVNTRYGEVQISLEKAVFFPKGLLGLSQFKDFAVTEMPNPKLAQFKLLQSLNDSQLSFVVLPIDANNKIIDAEDIEECSRVTGIKRESLLMLLIITAQQMPDGKLKVTANLRAPIVVDADEKLAIQYVFSNNKYEIQHPLA